MGEWLQLESATKSGKHICVVEEALMCVDGDKKGDVEVGKRKKLGQFKHGVHMALCREREDDNMGYQS